MKKTVRTLTALLLALLLCLSLAACGKDDPKNPDESGSKEGTKEQIPVVDPTDTKEKGTEKPQDTDPPETEKPKETEPVTEEPVTEEPETDEPEETEEIYTDVGLFAKGQFKSTISDKIVLLLDWSLSRQNDGKVAMKLDASLQSWAISSNAKKDMSTFEVGTQTKTFSTPEFHYDGSGKTVTKLASETFILEGNEEYLPVRATWKMLGVYGGQKIDDLVAEGVLDLLDLPEEYLIH